jgi:hypothetical protein
MMHKDSHKYLKEKGKGIFVLINFSAQHNLQLLITYGSNLKPLRWL